MRPITYLIAHHSASTRDTTTTKDILDWHRAKGWVDIGYHWVVDAKGIIHPGRPWESIGAHAKGYNRHSLGVCLVGDNTRPEQRWTQAQCATLGQIADSLRLLWPKLQVIGHRDTGAATECPGLDIYTLQAQDWALSDAVFRPHKR